MRKYVGAFATIFGGALIFLPLLISEPMPRISLTVSAMLIHESGHVAASLALGHGAPRPSLRPFGALLYPRDNLSYRHEAIICAAGPAANLAVSALCATHPENDGVFFFLSVNLLFALSNLLPVFSLDGGRIFACIVCPLFGVRAGERISRAVSLFFWCILWFASVFAAGIYGASPHTCVLLLMLLASDFGIS